MKTIYTTLPIYDTTLKQDHVRSGCIIPIYCPRHRLPSWQYNTEAVVVGAVTRIDLVNLSTGALTDITTYFPTLSDAHVLTTDTYYKYDGDTLKYLLPYGVYYLKITHANSYIYYSEIFTVTDIYPKLVESFTNVSYDTFTKTGTTISSAINLAGSASANSAQFTLRPGEKINVIFHETLTSGQAPSINLVSVSLASAEDTSASAAGLNNIELTASIGDTYYIEFSNSAASNFATSEIFIIRKYSEEYIRIDFHDTHDLGDIVYQSGFTQSLWLNTRLTPPKHEPVLYGEEKNGIFVTEKIVTKYKYRIVTYVGPVFYRALIRLPQHDTIEITDEVGFSYTPDIGNVTVSPINQNYFDWGTLEIIFNDNTEFVWTKEANNLT